MATKQIDPHTICPNDQDAIHKYITNISEDKQKEARDALAYFFPIWAASKYKKRMIDELADEDKKYLFQIILIVSHTQDKVNGSGTRGNESSYNDTIEQSEDINRKAVEEIIIGIRDGNTQNIEKLKREFKNRSVSVRDVFVKRIWDYKISHLPKKKREQIENLHKHTGKEDIIRTIIAYQYRDDKCVKILDEAVNIFDFYVKNIDLSVFSPKALQNNEAHIDNLVELVSNPKCLIPYNAINILKGVDVPNSWYICRSLSVSEYRRFCENITDIEEWSSIINKSCVNILKKIDVPIAPIIARKSVITEIIKSLRDRRFEVSMLSMYAEIEGLLWDFAFEINRNEEVFDKNDSTGKTLIDVDSGEPFKSDRIRDIIERTAVKNHVDAKFITDFCKGIYEERNPILHGRQNCFAACQKSVLCITQKLMTIEYVLDLIIEEFQKNLFMLWDNLPTDVLERTLIAHERFAKVKT